MTDRNPLEDETRTHAVLAPDTKVQQYRIVEKIGAGGMGEVYLAEDPKLRRKVALKFLPSALAHDPDIRARFTREAQASAGLDHPNIVTVYEVGEFEDRPFFAMQYVQGETLQSLARNESLNFAKITRLIAEVCEGLCKAHAAGIVHRDIKSANIIVDSDMRPRLFDFGLATISDGGMLTKTGSTLGTVAYMSPEQAKGLNVDQRTDLFSLGVVLYELITGRTPFMRDNESATLNAILNEEPEPLARYKAQVPPELQRVVSKCLKKRPEERYQTAADLATDLRAIEEMSRQGQSRTSGKIAASQPSIAVLPFTNMSADPENEYFSDGLTEELLNVLAKNPEMKVTGRTSSFAFKGKQEDLRHIGRKLGVETLLEGSVRKAGNRVRITAQLVSAADGFHIWSETYDRVLDDIFAVQDEIAKSVAVALNVTLLGDSEPKRQMDAETYGLILRANHLVRKWNEEASVSAIRLYHEAIEHESENAAAWAGLARAYTVGSAYGFGDTLELYKLGKEAALRSLELDDNLPAAHEVMGWTLAAFEHNFREARGHFLKAQALAPNDSRVVSSVSMMYGLLGDYENSLTLAKKAVELDPLNPEAYMNYGKLLFWADEFEKSRDICYRALELSPNMASLYLTICWNYLLEGRLDEALNAAEKEESGGYRYCGLANVYDAMGKRNDADGALAELLACGEQWGVQFATVYAYRKDYDSAFHWLEKSIELHDAGIPLTKVHPMLRNLHSDPRWPRLLEKIGFDRPL